MSVIVGRTILFALAIFLSVWLGFACTPELKGVKNATFYRISVTLLYLRGTMFLLFTILNLFPLEE